MTNIVLITPVATAESERCFSTLKRIKTCLRNAMGQDRPNALALAYNRDRIHFKHRELQRKSNNKIC